VTSGLHKSVFKDYSWTSDSQAGVMVEDMVRPGMVAHFTLELRAPMTPGLYREGFVVAMGGNQALAGGLVTLPITVNSTNASIANGVDPGIIAAAPAQTQTTSNGTYKTIL
jgi:hypothetical protein